MGAMGLHLFLMGLLTYLSGGASCIMLPHYLEPFVFVSCYFAGPLKSFTEQTLKGRGYSGDLWKYLL